MRLVLMCALALCALGGNARAYDCKDASIPAEFVICSDPHLGKLVAQRDRALSEARARSNEEQRKALNAEQRRWLKEYPKGCGIADSGKAPDPIGRSVIACFAQAIAARTAALDAYARPAGNSAARGQQHLAPVTSAAPAAASPAAAPAAEATGEAPAPAAGKTYHLKFTFACRSPAKLAQVLAALQRNDFSFPLNQDDCLPVPEGREATLLSLAGNVAKIRLCSPGAGCVDVYADAAALEPGPGSDSAGNSTASK